ncbi:MAG: glycine betaine ABC transporter substrate-binding protein [Micromonosporaceae bacterium]
MHTPVRRQIFRTFALFSALALTGALAAGCGEAGSSGGDQPGGAAKGEGCEPVAGKELVVLEDDKKLQTVDNVVPAINAKKATPELIAALDAVSAALTTDKLIALNKAVDVERKSPDAAAAAFAKAEGIGSGLKKGSGSVTIGVADFSENKTLGALYASALKSAGFTASVRTIGNRELYEPALEKGEVHIVPEYVGTLTEFLNQKVNKKGAKPVASSDLDATMKELTALGGKVGLKFGKASAAADQNAFAVTKAFADEHGVKTLTEFAEKCSGKATVLGGPPECPKRPFCQPGLKETYELEAGSFKSLDAGGKLTKDALRNGDITIGLVFSSDAQLSA